MFLLDGYINFFDWDNQMLPPPQSSIMRGINTQIFEIEQPFWNFDLNGNKAKTADKAFFVWDQYIR